MVPILTTIITKRTDSVVAFTHRNSLLVQCTLWVLRAPASSSLLWKKQNNSSLNITNHMTLINAKCQWLNMYVYQTMLFSHIFEIFTVFWLFSLHSHKMQDKIFHTWNNIKNMFRSVVFLAFHVRLSLDFFETIKH